MPSTRIDIEHHFQYADLAVRHPEAWDLYWDILVPLKVYKAIGSASAQARQLFDVLMKAIRLVDLQQAGSPEYYASCARASRFLKKELPRFESTGMGRLTLVGHSHIDTAWLWPLRETRRKVARTFSTVLALMERYPESHFSCSQPELYMYVKEHFPNSGSASSNARRKGAGSPAARRGSNRTATCRAASRWYVSSSTAIVSSSGNSACDPAPRGCLTPSATRGRFPRS